MSKFKKGFTLLEVIVATAVWMILAVGASHFLWYTSQQSTNLLSGQEAFENARVAVDALTVNLQMADEIILNTDADGMLRHLSLRQINPGDRIHWFEFSYDINALPGTTRYNRLEFGGHNELASHLSEVRLTLSNNRQLMHITVTTSERLGNPVTLTSAVDIRYKRLTVR